MRLGLPLDRPLLRLNNAYDPRSVTEPPQGVSGGKATRLQNVHVGISPSPISGGTLHIIEGSYDYHHYMQVCLAAVCGWMPRTSGGKCQELEERFDCGAHRPSGNMVQWSCSARVCAVKGLDDNQATLPVHACCLCLHCTWTGCMQSWRHMVAGQDAMHAARDM